MSVTTPPPAAKSRPVYRLEIRSTPSEIPDVVRLRHVLKGLLRSFGFKCLSIEIVQPAERVNTGV